MIRAAFPYVVGVLVFAVVILTGYVWFQSQVVDRLKTENAALRASIVSYEAERDLAREAQAVAEARARNVEEKAQEYDALREDVLRNGEDADLPSWLLNLVIGLRPD